MTLRQFATVRYLLGGFGIALVAAASGTYAFVGAEQERPPAEARPLPVRTLTLSKANSYRQARSYTGTVAAARTVDAGFQRGGQIVELLVDEGDVASEGQLLGRLDDRRLRAALDEANAQLDAAKAMLDELTAGPRAQELAAAEAEALGLAAEHELQKRSLARRESLAATNVVTAEEVEQYRYQTQAADKRREAAYQRWQELVEGTRSERLAAQKAVVVQWGARIADIEEQLRDSELRAPFSGSVTDRRADEGAVVASGEPVLRLVESDRLEYRFGLPVDAVRRLEREVTYRVRVGEREETVRFDRTVAELDPVRRTQTAIFVSAAGASGRSSEAPDEMRCIPGEVARLELDEAIDASGYAVPASALVRGSAGLWACYAVIPDEGTCWRVVRRDVEILHTFGDEVFVRGALGDGERIAADGVHRLVQNQKVEPVSAIESLTAAR